MRSLIVILAIAAIVAAVVQFSVNRNEAAAQEVLTGCASVTWDDWLPHLDDHIDEYDPAVVTPTGYIKIDEARRLVWFAGKAHGRDGFTECPFPDPPHTPTPIPPTPTFTPTATPTPTLIGCRWPDGSDHTFSATISPDYDECVEEGGQLEYKDWMGNWIR